MSRMSRPELKKDLSIKSYEDLPIGTYSEGMLLTETMELKEINVIAKLERVEIKL